ncbi:MAG: hypothetical protein ACREQX_00190 [Candidatus Binataceae bacterium]
MAVSNFWRDARRAARFGLLILAITLTACGNDAGTTASVKPAMRGLIDLGDMGFYTQPSARAIPTNIPSEVEPFAQSFNGIVINLTWAQLQPDGPTPLGRDNALNQALAAVVAYNQQNPGAQLKVKLRVWAGLVAPNWIKDREGPIPINFYDPHSGITETGTVGQWWTPAYIQAWRALQRRLARRYDHRQLIEEIAVTSCASNTDEPFISWNADPATIQTLHQYGYSDAAQQSCLSGAIADYSSWKRTPIDFPFSQFQNTDEDVPPDPKITTDPGFTVAVMRQCHASGHCILNNQALRDPAYAPDLVVYNEMSALYSQSPSSTPLDFQTAAPTNIGSWCGAIGNGIRLHGLSYEMWGDYGGFKTMPDGPAIMANLAHAVRTDTQPAPSPCPAAVITPPSTTAAVR